MNIRKCQCLISLIFLTSSSSNASKILAAFIFPASSHFMMHKTIIKELLNRGHEVTVITPLSLDSNRRHNYTEILIPTYDLQPDILYTFKIKSKLELSKLTQFDFLHLMNVLGTKTTEFALKQPNVQEIINRNDTKNVYDLLIVEEFYQEAFLALSWQYDIPIVASSTLGQQTFMSQMMGVITPWSFVPHGSLALDDRMTFWQRVENTIVSLYDGLYREFVYYPKQDAMVKMYFSHLPIKIPTVSQMKKHTSVLLMNCYAPLTTPRPSIVGMVQVGAMHVYPPKTLPSNIKKFLDEAADGAIYFSFGSQLKASELPAEKLRIFFEVFSKMKQKVLWKFEDDSLTDVPSNVMIQKWMPQTDILAHPNVKVFITHGGLFGSQESLYHGVPLLGIPFYSDQYFNINKAAKAGYALTLDFNSINVQNLEYSLKELLENPSYRKEVQKISAIFRDRPISARESAMYWIEYVIRHKGAHHIRSAGLDLAWYEYYLLDVIGLCSLFIVVILTCFVLILKKSFLTYKSKEKIN